MLECEASGNVTVSTGFLDSRLKMHEVGSQGFTDSTQVHCMLQLLLDDSVGGQESRKGHLLGQRLEAFSPQPGSEPKP